MIYTSNFAKYRGENGISISRTQPRSKTLLPEVEQLKPPPWLLKSYKCGEISEEEFTTHYCKHVLRGLNPVAWGKRLQGKVLLCWEKSDSFCHRHIVADWLRKAGFEVKEWEKSDGV